MNRIIGDTTCSVPIKEGQKEGIIYLPQIIIFGDESYRDDTEMDSEQFLSKLKSSHTLPKTAAPPPALYEPYFKEISEKGDTAIVICPSSDLSGTTRSATVAAEDYKDVDIRIIDTRTVAGGLGSIVLQAAKWAKDEMDSDTLVQKIREMASRERVYFLVDTLEYLYKGGRIGGAQALMGSLLQVKPILTLVDGRANSAETQRTKKRAQARLKELVLEDCPHSPEAHLSVSHCDAFEEAQAFAKDLAEALGVDNVPIYDLPPAIIVHAGPKTIAVSYFRQK